MKDTTDNVAEKNAATRSWAYQHQKLELTPEEARRRFEEAGRVRPDLNGVAITAVPWGSGPVFVIDGGYRRGIVSEAVFVALYGTVPNHDLVREVLDLEAIPFSPAGNVYEHAYLVQANDIVTPVFIIDKISGQIVKRPFPSAEVFNQFQFSWDKVLPRAWGEIEGIPGGPIVEGRP
jgi:hypothetical protein